jgi:hypothetical protein
MAGRKINIGWLCSIHQGHKQHSSLEGVGILVNQGMDGGMTLILHKHYMN